MNGIPWWLVVPALIAVVVAVGFGLLAAWINWNAPRVQMRWRMAVRTENARQRAPEEVAR